MPLAMQGEKLLPGEQNIAGGSFLPRTPDRGRGDGATDAREEVGKPPPREFGDEFRPIDLPVMARFLVRLLAFLLAELMSENIDQGGFEFFCIGMAEFGLGQLLQTVM